MEVNLTDLSSGLIGLSILTGTNNLSALTSASAQLTSGANTAAARAAEALFTTPATAAPWESTTTTSSSSSSSSITVQAAEVKAMHSIVDTPDNSEAAGSDDVETTFVTYRALDRLKTLATAAGQSGLSDAERASLQTAFTKGLSDLQTYLAQAAGNTLSLAFGEPDSSAKSTTLLPTQDIGTVTGNGVLDNHNLPVPGITGNEVVTIQLDSGSHHDSVSVDLSTLSTQPPTLDAIAGAFNSAIASAGGGYNYNVKFSVDKSSGKYGLTMDSGGTRVSMQQANAGNALMVVSSQTQFDAPIGAQVYRYDDTAGGLVRQTLGSVTATDSAATAAAQAKARADAAAAGTSNSSSSSTDGSATTDQDVVVQAGLTAQASVTTSDGFTYVVGTADGDTGTYRSDGQDDLYLAKLDSEGKVVWQQQLGVAGTAQGAAISLAPNGDVVVAGSVTGPFDGNVGSNSDMLVARFSDSGEKQFASSIASTGDDVATAVTVGNDGSIYLGGKSAGGNGNAYIAHMDANGKMLQQRTIDSGGADRVSALAIDASGNLLALTRENGEAKLHSIASGDLTDDLGTLSFGSADARAIAVNSDGSIAVAGATTTALADNPGLPAGDGTDGFVTRLNADLSGASTTYIGSTGEDQIDSVAFMDGDIYVGGRTTSALNGNLKGKVDGFVGHIDGSTGAVSSISQFGGSEAVVDPVKVTAATGGTNILGALGLHRGALNGDLSTSLSTQLGLDAGDSFSLQLDGGAVHKITIDDGETLTSLQLKIKAAMGTSDVNILTPRNDQGQIQLQFSVGQGHTLSLIAGPTGSDALAKLGLDPTRLHSDPVRGPKDPLVKPGGSYGLNLDTGLSLGSTADAQSTLEAITSAISMTQSAYRSLYWDDTKVAIVNGGNIGPGTARQQAQLASYQAALTRLTSGTSSSLFL